MDTYEISARETIPNGDETKFWETSIILLNNPHTINRRIAVSAELLLTELTCPVDEILKLLGNLSFSFVPNAEENDWLKMCTYLLNESKQRCGNERIQALNELRNNKIYLRIAKLFARDQKKFAMTLEFAVIDRLNNKLTFCHRVTEKQKRTLALDFIWNLQWRDSELLLGVEKNGLSSASWLKDQLFPKFVKWMCQFDEPKDQFLSGSLNLVDQEKYVLKYDELKKKYGTEMVRIWPENTDPMKFVYEDVAIATYLLLLWEDERQQKNLLERQSFVDLGCGNGLLVHILSSEGYKGFGIDLRRRKIWDLFPPTIKLEVRTIIPSSSNLFPEIDWLIGNHSDELTPWIPVIAARSSYKCRFFLLPCCAYEFDGSKYQRHDSHYSQYHDYMNYVKSISEACGFKTQVDKLRIPSTKRICFIGSDRNYLKVEHQSQELKIQEVIHKRSGKTTKDEWSADFKPRDVVEKVRNCTKIDKGLIGDIIKIVSSELLKGDNVLDLGNKKWNAGGMIELGKVVTLLDPDQLKQLKNECGGLQTLFKNNGDIFKIVEGKVRLKRPSDFEISRNSKSKKRIVQRPGKHRVCWFYVNHPDGCPVKDEDCTFLHDVTS